MIKNEKTFKGLTIKTKRTIFAWAMLALPLIQWLVFFVYVNLNSITMSFQSVNYGTGKISWTLENYRRFFYEWQQLPQMKNAVKNSLFAGLNDLVLLLISVIFAYLFYKKVPGRHIFRIVFFLPSIISIVVYTMVYKYMFNMSMGPVNKILETVFKVPETKLPTWFGDKNLAFPLVMLYCLWVGTGYNILIIGGAIENLPEDVMEYSRLDGVGFGRELFQIVIPMIWPTISVGLLSSVTTVFMLFIQVDLLTGGGPNQSSQTIAYLINGLIKGGSANLEWGACMGICFTVVATPIIIIVKKLLDKTSEKFGF